MIKPAYRGSFGPEISPGHSPLPSSEFCPVTGKGIASCGCRRCAEELARGAAPELAKRHGPGPRR